MQKNKLFKKIVRNSAVMAGVFFAICSFVYPNSSEAATSSLQINQQAGDVTPTPTEGGGGGGMRDVLAPQISEVVVTVNFNSAIVAWKTAHEFSTSKVSWGTNSDYTDGVLSSSQLLREHSTQIDSLKENTIYYFLITAIDASGNQSFYDGRFVTGKAEDLSAPANVKNFKAVVKQNAVSLSWTNPSDTDFNFTRIVRSTTFFPTDPYNGQVVFEGQAENFEDKNVIPGVLYYYSAFTRDTNGNYSSGTLTTAKIVWFSESEVPISDLQFLYDKNFTGIKLTAKDFSFSIQNGLKVLDPQNISFSATEQLTITIDKNKLPTDAKFIIWNSDVGSFLFSFNAVTQKYELTLPAMTAFGINKGTISIFNSAQEVLQDVPVIFTTLSSGLKAEVENFTQTMRWVTVAGAILLILSLIFLIRFFHRRRVSNSEE
jgi:hypothetical protein